MHLSKHGKGWRAEFYFDNVKYRTATRRDKMAALQLGTDRLRRMARGEADCLDRFASTMKAPIGEILRAYTKEQTAKGRDRKWVYICQTTLERLFAEMPATTLADVTLRTLTAWRDQVHKSNCVSGETKVCGPGTVNGYLERCKAFLRWAERMSYCPHQHAADACKVDKLPEHEDIRRARRALSDDEVVGLLNAATPEHRLCYRVILLTGLRRAEAVALQWGDLHLDAVRPFVQLRATTTKNAKADTLPLHPDLVQDLRQQWQAHPATPLAAVLTVPSMANHRAYLAAAKIAYEDDQGRRADFHALRHTYITNLNRAGVAPRMAMQLARHSDIRLTMKTYTNLSMTDLSAAIGDMSIPTRTSDDQQRATGTADATGDLGDNVGINTRQMPHLMIPYCTSVEAGDSGHTKDGEQALANASKALHHTALIATTVKGSKRADGKTSASRTRTYNIPVNSRMLYH